MSRTSTTRVWLHAYQAAALSFVLGCTSDASANAPTAHFMSAQVAGEGVTAVTDAAASVYHRFVQQATGGPLSFDSERFDNASVHDEVANNSRLTVPTGHDGFYLISFYGWFSDFADGATMEISIRKNGTTIIGTATSTSPVETVSLTFHEALGAGDYVEVLANDLGDNASFLGGAAKIAFELVRVR